MKLAMLFNKVVLGTLLAITVSVQLLIFLLASVLTHFVLRLELKEDHVLTFGETYWSQAAIVYNSLKHVCEKKLAEEI